MSWAAPRRAVLAPAAAAWQGVPRPSR